MSSENQVRPNFATPYALAFALIVFPGSAHARDAAVLFNFNGSGGGNPAGGMIADEHGNLYGTAYYGGYLQCQDGCGVVFKVAPNGSETVLHAFEYGTDGNYPRAGLVADKAGNLYGTTQFGGTGTGCNDNGCGSVFEVSPDSSEKVLYSFEDGADGSEPISQLVLDKKGNLYGTASSGGSTGLGTIFKVTTQGDLTVLYTFRGGSDGSSPYAGLILDKEGNLYGTTANGGNTDCFNGCGTVFKLAPNGTETVLHRFKGGNDGSYPVARLVADNEGNLYGTTVLSGSGANCTNYCGTVFKLAPDGTETILHAFQGGNDGESPYAGVIADRKGNIFGTTLLGGANGIGTVFKIAPDGTESVLYAFTSNIGANPEAGLIMDRRGNLYGTAITGGDNDCQINYACGTIFEVEKGR